MSPEQATAKLVGPRSDLYSLGVVLYEMLTGRVPYDVKTPEDVAAKHASRLPHPRELNPEVPMALDAVVVKLLATDPKDRYGNAAQLLEELGKVGDVLPLAVPPSNEATTVALDEPTVPVLAPSASGNASNAGGARSRRLSGRALWILTALAAMIGVLAGLGMLGWGPWQAPDRVDGVHAVKGGPPVAPAPGSNIPSAGVAGGTPAASASVSASASASASAPASTPSSSAPLPRDNGGRGTAAQEQYR
jgi:serine/threonine protein kinase